MQTQFPPSCAPNCQTTTIGSCMLSIECDCPPGFCPLLLWGLQWYANPSSTKLRSQLSNHNNRFLYDVHWMRLSSRFLPFAALRFTVESWSTRLRDLHALLPAGVWMWRTWFICNARFLWWVSHAIPLIWLIKTNFWKLSEDSCTSLRGVLQRPLFLSSTYVEMYHTSTILFGSKKSPLLQH